MPDQIPETPPENPPAPEVDFTDRELAIIEGRNPDDVQAESTPETSETAAGKEAEAVPSASVGTEADLGTGTPEVTQPTAWYDDSDKEVASTYGWSDEDLKGFKDKDDFRRVASLFDRQLIGRVQQHLQPPPQAPAAPKPPETKAPVADDSIDPQKYIEAGFDEHTVALAKAFKTQQDEYKAFKQNVDQFLSEQRQAVEQRQHTEKISTFHDMLDATGRYGKSLDDKGNATQVDAANNAKREKIYRAAEELALGRLTYARETGQPLKMPSYKALIESAEQLVFGQELARQAAAAQQAKIAEQSKRRRPAAGHRTPATGGATSDKVVDPVQALVNNPQLKKMWNEMHDEAGQAP